MIKMMKHYVQDTETGIKARIRYSMGKLTNDPRQCVTLYEKDYTGNLGKIFPQSFENRTDSQQDYFERDCVRIFSDNPLFFVASTRAMSTGFVRREMLRDAQYAAM